MRLQVFLVLAKIKLQFINSSSSNIIITCILCNIKLVHNKSRDRPVVPNMEHITNTGLSFTRYNIRHS